MTHANRRTNRPTDGHDELIGAFRNYANSPKHARNADANEKVVIMTMMRRAEIVANKDIVGKVCTQVDLNVLPTKKGRKKERYRNNNVPYILESKPHPNLIRTSFFADFLNEKKVSSRF
jgi:hypothetical protein